MAKKASNSKRSAKGAAKQTKFSQSDFPRTTLQEAQRIAVGIWENFAGTGATPPDIALAIGTSPTSSAWRVLCGSSIAYGLTAGGHNADQVTLTPLGKKLVAPEVEGEDVAARLEAILKPRHLAAFFEKYRRAKFPNDIIGKNVLQGFGLPKDRLDEALEVVKANGRYAGVIRDTPTGPFVNLDSPGVPAPAATLPDKLEEGDKSAGSTAPATTEPSSTIGVAATKTKQTNKVFISHGKQKSIAAQIRELLLFGQLEPVVSVERESTAIPVPEKVFEDMRSCSAGVIHVGAEGECLDSAGGKHTRINENVLIEIGAAMALYGKRVILLVEKGLPLPSNLQGLYRCEYEGDRLDYDATMKLLKTFNQFRG